MQFDPLHEHKPIQDDWAPVRNPAKPKRSKRKLNILLTRKYIHSKGTMVRVRKEPDLPKECVILYHGNPCFYSQVLKVLFPADNSAPVTIFQSRLAAKRARWHTIEQAAIPCKFSDFQIVPKDEL